MDQYIGKKLDNRYEILEVIGTGGMAVVYKARCHRLNRMVAIKILRDELACDDEFRRRFHDEPQAVAMLSHHNIMAIYDVSKSSDVEYIVMELIDGLTLKQYMTKRGEPLNWREALHFMTQIMKALSHAHDRGIIHRDIKPQNIMVLRDGSIKVTDFGIARLASASQNTLTQEALGSVHYMSPEQAKGSRIDQRADIYSAGVVLYEMLTGRLPFEGDTPVSVAIQHINSIPLTPREINTEIPEAVEAITMRAMAPDLDRRYGSAEEMLTDLEEFRKNPNIRFDYTAADLIAPSGVSDEPTQVMKKASTSGTAGETVATVDKKSVAPAPKGEPEEREPVMERKSKKQSAGLSVPLAILAVLVFVVGIGMFLWVTFFSAIFNPQPTGQIVPDLTGKILEEVMADSDITTVFNVREGDLVPSSSIAAGTIIDQSPEDGTTVKGDYPTIIVTVSAGEASIPMPDLVNREYRDALAELNDLGLKNINTVQETSDTVTTNYIIRTEPLAEVAVTSGEAVTIYISQGPEIKMRTMLSVIDMDLEQATSIIIEDLHLNMGTVTEIDSEKPKNTVVYQSIPVNTEVAEGSTIALQVSKGPEEEELPDETIPPPEVSDEGGTSTEVVPTPTPEPTPSPEPVPSSTPAVATTVSQSYTVNIPQDDRETIKVRILVGDSVQFESVVQVSVKFIAPFISGSGTQQVSVYFDDVLFSSEDVTFS